MLPLTPWSRRSNRRGGSRTHGLRLIRTPLSPLSYTPASRAGGNRTHTVRIKSPPCCLLHHDPGIGRAYAFQSTVAATSQAPSFHDPSGSPENRTRRTPVISRRWATSPRLPIKSGWSDSNRRFRVPGTRGLAATLHPDRKSERRDLNPRSLGPRPARCQASPRSDPVPRGGVEPKPNRDS